MSATRTDEAAAAGCTATSRCDAGEHDPLSPLSGGRVATVGTARFAAVGWVA